MEALIIKVLLGICAFGLAIVGVSDLKSTKPAEAGLELPWWRRLTPAGGIKIVIAVLTLGLLVANEYLTLQSTIAAKASAKEQAERLTDDIDALSSKNDQLRVELEQSEMRQRAASNQLAEVLARQAVDLLDMSAKDFGVQVIISSDRDPDRRVFGALPILNKRVTIGSLTFYLPPILTTSFSYGASDQAVWVSPRVNGKTYPCRTRWPFDSSNDERSKEGACAEHVEFLSHYEVGNRYRQGFDTRSPVTASRLAAEIAATESFGGLSYNVPFGEGADEEIRSRLQRIFLAIVLYVPPKDSSLPGDIADDCVSFVQFPLRFDFPDEGPYWPRIVRNGPMAASSCVKPLF